MRGLTLGDLRDKSLDDLARELEERLRLKLGPRLLGDPYPEVGLLDWIFLAAYVVKKHEQDKVGKS